MLFSPPPKNILLKNLITLMMSVGVAMAQRAPTPALIIRGALEDSDEANSVPHGSFFSFDSTPQAHIAKEYNFLSSALKSLQKIVMTE